MKTSTAHATHELPSNTRLRTQVLLDEADRYWFANNPSETGRIRFYFKGERIDDHGVPARYVVVTRNDHGALVRRFAAADEAVAS